MTTDFFEEEHHLFRESVRKFVDVEIMPHREQWDKDGMVPRELWLKAGAQGLLCPDVPEEYGGLGLKDYRYNLILAEELVRASGAGAGFCVHSDMVVPYITNYGTEEQKRKFLPRAVSGECITAVAMTEPNTGSDLNGIQTRAERHGDYYLLNGQKTFITNGILNDMVIVVARTDPEKAHGGISLLIVERGMEGYERGRKLEKLGLHAQDTAELYFKDARVPVSNLIGEEGQGFAYLMRQLPQERLSIAALAVGASQMALDITVDYCRERTAFGRPIGKFQHNRFKLAEMKTEIELGRVFVHHCVSLHNRGELTAEKAAMAKWWTTEMQLRVINAGVQLHGGYGYMLEYPIARAYADARAQTIYGGTTEIMKEV
ncbi:MAG TPA: acyl-CoA dehydrogenase family protein, partial [Candidatus Hydrogenedentes bacterium]|nr:acyl-CoA dehydrogenase family protein [Candidatus Hydrogenedentota bacterium]